MRTMAGPGCFGGQKSARVSLQTSACAAADEVIILVQGKRLFPFDADNTIHGRRRSNHVM